ncbi:aldehyde dehydrogenase family protein [Aquicoccus sp. G2-2]|uniref:aldehyde dehydrogenase family protein n=1 Tax=Aquicoccus sp. G2-2 TaxID=3092120 RepID=UPI002ADF6F6A|nr:aldehyde dehydrogenase family protein [Aquicoccus sp. G2-2]MEA1115265.1 aldehyde dehydrogenase family protein [Aquicoccus sp. G2-2]
MKIDIFNPAHPSQKVASYSETDPSDIGAIIAKAQKAQLEWGQVPQPERGTILNAYLDALAARSEEIAASITSEMGKLIGESRGEVAKGIGEGRMTTARAGNPIGEVLPSQIPGVTAYTTRRPRGVVLGINPWNFPFSTPTRKTFPALVYGNAIILKPASISPGACVLMQEIAKGILPDGLLQVVVGSGRLGGALSEHEGIDAISFTGSVGVGKEVALAAASRLVEVNLELGGKNPAIVNDASDLGAVADEIVKSAFAVSGQRCNAVSRVIVQTDLAEALTDALEARIAKLVLGEGADPASQIGPLSSEQQLRNVAGFVERAEAAGVRVVTGGPVEGDGGYYYGPTLLTDVTRDMEVARAEVFGPVLSVLSYVDIDDALDIANGVAFGLASCLFSERAEVIDAFAARSESGMLHINVGSFPENHLPFVGVKQSALGVGGSNGASTVQFYTSEHTIYRRATVR